MFADNAATGARALSSSQACTAAPISGSSSPTDQDFGDVDNYTDSEIDGDEAESAHLDVSRYRKPLKRKNSTDSSLKMPVTPTRDSMQILKKTRRSPALGVSPTVRVRASGATKIADAIDNLTNKKIETVHERAIKLLNEVYENELDDDQMLAAYSLMTDKAKAAVFVALPATHRRKLWLLGQIPSAVQVQIPF